MKTSVVSRLPTSTMNMTGFLIWIRGSSFFNESSSAGRTIAASQKRTTTSACGHGDYLMASSARLSSSTLTRGRPKRPNAG